jgi:RNA polymerase sigma-70 factor (ECF subfamily)
MANMTSGMATPPTPADLEHHRRALTGHCYRMLGSVVDADDAVQDTMLRALRSLDAFAGRASLRSWLYRIATNVCLDALSERSRRALPFEEGSSGSTRSDLTQHPREHWLEPVPDALVLPTDVSPDEALLLQERIKMAFVASLQHLPARQRAALLLTNVLGFSAAETADTLSMTVAATNSALQRARATLEEKGQSLEAQTLQATPENHVLLERFMEAFQRYDTAALAALLSDDVAMCMPPYDLWLQGPAMVRAWLDGPGIDCRGSLLLPTRACGRPAFAQYRVDPDGGHSPWALIHLEVDGDRIVNMIYFLDTETLFPRFGLPARLDQHSAGPGESLQGASPSPGTS